MTTQTAHASIDTESVSKALHFALWGVQALLAVAFLIAGATKIATPLAELAQQLPWVADVPGALVRFIGAAEVAGGLGLVLPAATRIKPMLTPLAAAGLTVVMVLGAATHLIRGEAMMVPVNFTLGGLALFVAWGRARRARIQARS